MWTSIESPLGPVKVVAHRGAVTAVEFTGPVAAAATAGPRSSVRVAVQRATGRPVGERADDDPLLRDAVAQLAGYFAREVKEFDLPLRPDGTPFQQRVWEQLRRVPYGETTSYGEIARRLGMHAGASRPVGAANGRNPIAIVIPCHRVVGTNGLLSGYAGGVERKQALLDLEQHALF
ncbi:MAG: methylated-DNA--[protein]-cysteine S-methyltransferase [Actinomycetes bacterium]